MAERFDSRSVSGRWSLRDAWCVLEQTGWLSGCDSRDRELLFSIAELRSFEAGEFVYRIGDPAEGVYGFVEGAVDIEIPRLDGEMFIFHRSGPGTWAGDLALFSSKDRLLSLQAAHRSVAVFLPRQGLFKLVGAHPRIMECFYRLTYENVALIVRLLGSLAVTGAENRVALRLLSLAETDEAGQEIVEVSQARLAQYVALSDQSVRRAVRKLEKAGLIETGYGRYRILNREGLAALCGYTR